MFGGHGDEDKLGEQAKHEEPWRRMTVLTQGNERCEWAGKTRPERQMSPLATSYAPCRSHWDEQQYSNQRNGSTECHGEKRIQIRCIRSARRVRDDPPSEPALKDRGQ